MSAIFSSNISFHLRKEEPGNGFEDLAFSSARLLSAERVSLRNAVAMIMVISPENILKKGFAIVKKNSEITSDPGQFMPESENRNHPALEKHRATVNTNTEYHGNDFDLPESY